MTFEGLIIYHYNFTNEKGQKIETTKALFNIKGLPVYINSNQFNVKKIGSTVICDLEYDGSKWVVKKGE